MIQDRVLDGFSFRCHFAGSTRPDRFQQVQGDYQADTHNVTQHDRAQFPVTEKQGRQQIPVDEAPGYHEWVGASQQHQVAGKGHNSHGGQSSPTVRGRDVRQPRKGCTDDQVNQQTKKMLTPPPARRQYDCDPRQQRADAGGIIGGGRGAVAGAVVGGVAGAVVEDNKRRNRRNNRRRGRKSGKRKR